MGIVSLWLDTGSALQKHSRKWSYLSGNQNNSDSNRTIRQLNKKGSPSMMPGMSSVKKAFQLRVTLSLMLYSSWTCPDKTTFFRLRTKWGRHPPLPIHNQNLQPKCRSLHFKKTLYQVGSRQHTDTRAIAVANIMIRCLPCPWTST